MVIVEGPSDDEALELLFNRIYDQNVVHVEIVHGDITTTTDSAHIVAKIGDFVRIRSTRYFLKQSDYQEVIHLVDTDGCFIPDSSVILDSSAEKPFYTEQGIRTVNPDGICFRNRKKRDNVKRLASLNHVWRSIPYSVYYMSCNLDHVLYNKLNSTDEDKERDAIAFAKKYKDDVPGFIAYMTKSDFSVCEDYRKSWNYIQEDRHSLKRHSNLGIAFLKSS
ncbi:hypothetical protein [Clostridium vitabionis]|uniref:hypothetical protein n=1 Tax=Clostridium vitabionis TaxID=2784388 RepID=UPI001F39DBFF|nr:hypothetical protein [Clostridium vitabionis]